MPDSFIKMPQSDDPFVSLLIPIRNEARYIERCLQAVLAQDYPPKRMEVLVIDGMSTDGTREKVQALIESRKGTAPEIVLLDNPPGIVPTGLNIGLRRARGEIIVRVDGHCVIAPNYVSACVAHIKNLGVDGVGGPMESIGETSTAQLIATVMSSPFGVGNSFFRTVTGKTMFVDTVPFPAYTKEIIRKAGLYDEELVRDQDDEYNYRIRALGGRVLLADDVRSRYFSRASLKSLWRQYFQYGYWKVRVLQKHPLQMRPRQFVPPLFVLALIFSMLLAFIPGVRWLALVVPGLYLLANLTASLITAAKKGWRLFPLLPLAFAILHLSYGLGFLAGLVRFARRWRDRTGKTPLWTEGG